MKMRWFLLPTYADGMVSTNSIMQMRRFLLPAYADGMVSTNSIMQMGWFLLTAYGRMVSTNSYQDDEGDQLINHLPSSHSV